MFSYFRVIKENLSSFLISLVGAIVAALPIAFVLIQYTLPQFEKSIVLHKNKEVQIAVESVFNVLEFYNKKVSAHELTQEKAQELAMTEIKQMRYQEKEYFWINDLEPKMIMHPLKPEMDNTNISNFSDPTGKKIFVEMVKVAKNSGSGFVEYMWPKPNEKDPSPKTSFVKLYEPWGWIIGSGVYADDVKAEVSEIRSKNIFWFLCAALFVVFISALIALRQLVKVIVPVKEVITALTEEAETLSETAESLSAAAKQLSSAEETQSSSIHQTAAAMTQMNEMIAKTSDSAQNSAELARETSSTVEEGLSFLQHMDLAMNQIATAQEKTENALNENLQKMVEVTNIISKISEKTKLINDIVFQTKLLSFNASVEAARAGEYGKGFAVVAEEVGNLAQMSGRAAQEISQIVNDSNQQVMQLTETIKKDLMIVIDEVKTSINEGHKYSAESLEKFNSVVQIAGQSSEMSNTIREASVEQHKGSQEATEALRVMEKTSREMETVVTNTEKQSRNLLEQSQHLQEITLQLAQIVEIKKAS